LQDSQNQKLIQNRVSNYLKAKLTKFRFKDLSPSVLIINFEPFNFWLMSLQLYNPFATLHFDEHSCFLSGDDLNGNNEIINVFPDWVLDDYDFRERNFEMMDTVNQTTYGALTLPCSKRVKKAMDELDAEVKSAFDKGFEAVEALDHQKLFLWAGRMVYGVLYQELMIERMRSEKRGIEFELSKTLKKRFAYFHLMLQSLISPVRFTENKAWSIALVRLKYSKDIFNYRDDAVNLIFSLGFNGFGIIAVLQDNGVLYNEYKGLLSKTSGKVLHPVQFEELCARFLYSNYLLQYPKNFSIRESKDGITIDALPVIPEDGKPLFKPWIPKTFGQVLHDYWSPWGFTEKEIFDSQNVPVSFLENQYTFELIEPESILLPY